MSIRRYLIFICLLAVFAITSVHVDANAAVGSGETSPLQVPSVSEAILLAIENSGDVQTARLQLEEAGIGLNTLYSALTGFRVDAHVNDQLTRDQRTQQGFGTDDPVNTLSATVSVRKALAVGPRAAATLSEQLVPLQQAERAVSRQIADVIVTTFDAYRQLELALMRYELAVTGQQLAEEGFRVAQDRLKHDAMTPADAEQARLQLVEATNETRYARNMLDVVWIHLAQLIGVDPHTVSIHDVPVRSLEETLQLITDGGEPFELAQPHPWPHQTENDMVLEALENRGELEDVKSLIALADIATEKASLDKRPSFELRAGYTTTDNVSTSVSVDNEWVLTGSATKAFLSRDPLLPPPGDEWEIGFGITFNLWDSGVVNQSIERGMKAKEQAHIRLSQAKQGIELDVLSKHADLIRNYNALQLAIDRVLLAQARFDIEQEKLRLGTGTDLMINQAALNKWGSVIQAVADRFQYESALLSLAQAKGMDPTQLFELADHLQRW